MLRAALCQLAAADDCSCKDCFTVMRQQPHPSVQTVEPSTFSDQMITAFSYPTPIVNIPQVHDLPFRQQMQLLTWLEMHSNRHLILMSALNEQSLLPTIRSRSLIYRDIPKETLSDDEKQITFYQIKAVLNGKARPDEWIVADHEAIARRMFLLLVEDACGRFLNPPRQLFQVSQQDGITLLKLVSRYLESPSTHNLPLLLRSFSTLSLQNVR